MDKNQQLKDLKLEDQKAFELIYKKHFKMINRHVLNNGGNSDDAKDVFQDTIIVLLQKLRLDNFEVTASLQTYTMAIAKNIWLKNLRDRKSFKKVQLTNLHDTKAYEEINHIIEIEKQRSKKLLNIISKITDHCQNLIRDIFYKEKPIDEIQIEYGYTTKHNAQNQKYKCIEQLKKVMEKAN